MSTASLPCVNPRCGFDLSTFRASITVRSSGAAPLHCPACGEKVPLRLEAFGVFRIDDTRSSRFVAWKSSKSSALGDKPELPVGLFKVQLTPPPEVIRPEEVAFPAVPVFKGTDGSWQVPTLPVRPDRMVFLDPERPIQAGHMEHQEYVAKLHLRGLDKPLELRLPVMAADPDDRSVPDVERKAFRGVNLRMWPNVPFPTWKRFYLSLGAVDEEGKRKLFAPNRAMRAFWVVDGNAREFARSTAGGAARVACTDRRPEWLTLEFSDEKGNVLGGGCWQVPPARGSYPNRTLTLGADFGTSNTALAYRLGDAQPALVPNSEPYYVVHSGDEPGVHKHLEMWIPRTGFGPMKDLFASELLFANPVASLGDEDEVRRLKPIEDYCITQSGVRIAYDEKPHVVGGLKRQSGLEPASLRKTSLHRPLREHYLDFVAFLALGNIYSTLGDSAPGNIDLKFSYPLVFKKEDVEALLEDWEKVAHRIKAATGLQVDVDKAPIDEATAATGTLRPKKDTVRVVIDIGGGTTDIAVLWSTRSLDEVAPLVYVTSVDFAGTNILQAFQGMNKSPSCLLPTASIEALKRRVREAKTVREALAADDLLNSSREKLLHKRIGMFYGYLLEYMARMIVAPLGYEDGSFHGIHRDDDCRVTLPLRVEVLLLGNGWAFGDMVDSEGVVEMVDALLASRTTAIAASLGRDDKPQVKVSVRRPEGVSHPKAAVAMGLLNFEGGNGAHAADRKVVQRRIVGITTQVGDVSVPWWQEVKGKGDRKPLHVDYELEAGAYLDWDAGAVPKFPKSLRSPHELDENLDKTARNLMKAVSVERQWLQASPFEVLLQDLFALAVYTDGAPHAG